MPLYATKPQRYGTRALKAGDPFPDNAQRHRRVLLALGRAREGEAPAEAPEPQKAAPPAGDEIAVVRAEYERTVGKRPFMGWDIDTLRQKIADAKSEE